MVQLIKERTKKRKWKEMGEDKENEEVGKRTDTYKNKVRKKKKGKRKVKTEVILVQFVKERTTKRKRKGKRKKKKNDGGAERTGL